MLPRLSKRDLLVYSAVLGLSLFPFMAVLAGALEDYVNAPDPFYNWKRTEQKHEPWGMITRLELVSQHWRNQFWSHHVVVVRPHTVRNPDVGLLLIKGDGVGEDSVDMLKVLAGRAGAVAAVIMSIPNQPFYDRTEDALVAYTFDQYLKTNDKTWPLLFPMVKSAVRGMDTVQAFIQQAFNATIKRFVVAGASKRGWTTWLTAAVDPRVKGIAPMAIDMLNMKVQLQWAEKIYGKQSEKISDYTDLNLHQKLDDAPMQRLRSWVDPYAYRHRYTMPKLLLLGTNDPYWTVDSLRHYWNDLPGPKLIFQTPNARHDLASGREAMQTLAAFFQMLADRKPLPKVTWVLRDTPRGKATATLKVDQPAKAVRLWSATSADRDFRDSTWSSRELGIQAGSSQTFAEIERPREGYCAYLMEVELISPTGQPYKLSTEAKVTPDDIK
jgi:PhoPQ-activated pathogenicity-related protein